MRSCVGDSVGEVGGVGVSPRLVGPLDLAPTAVATGQHHQVLLVSDGRGGAAAVAMRCALHQGCACTPTRNPELDHSPQRNTTEWVKTRQQRRQAGAWLRAVTTSNACARCCLSGEQASERAHVRTPRKHQGFDAGKCPTTHRRAPLASGRCRNGRSFPRGPSTQSTLHWPKRTNERTNDRANQPTNGRTHPHIHACLNTRFCTHAVAAAFRLSLIHI